MSTESVKQGRTQSFEFKSFSRAQYASAATLIITAIVLTVITKYSPATLSNLYLKSSLYGFAGASLALFAVSSCLRYCYRPAANQNEPVESKARIITIEKHNEEDSTANETSAPRSEGIVASDIKSHNLDEEVDHVNPKTEVIGVPEAPKEQSATMEYLKTEIFPPFFVVLKDVVKAAVLADCRATQNASAKYIRELENQVAETFKEVEQLFYLLLDKQEIYVKEVLLAFGPGRVPLSVAKRRMIAAYNSGDHECYTQAKKEYLAIVQGNNLGSLEKKLEQGSITLDNFADHLASHFCVPDDEMKQVGLEVLQHIFAAGKNNKRVTKQFEELKKRCNSYGLIKTKKEDFDKELEAFISLAFDEANQSKRIPEELMQKWSVWLIEHTLKTQFKKTMSKILGMMARNLDMLEILFDESTPLKNLFVQLDTTFLASESSDLIPAEKEEMLGEILTFQSILNQSRDEKERVAFVILKSDDSRNFQTVIQEEEICKECCKSINKERLQELEVLSQRKEVLELNAKYQIRLVAIPVTISDHPFKLVKSHPTVVRAGAFLLKGFVSPLLKPQLLRLLPKLEGGQKQSFDRFFDGLLNLLINPVYNGAIGYTNFREPFKNIISKEGKELAKKLQSLASDPELTYEKIRDGWVGPVKKFTEEFNKVYSK